MTTPRQLWNDAKAGCPDAVLILEADGAYHTFGEDAKAVKYAMGWDEGKHPRVAAGSEAGGQFAPGEGTPSQGPTHETTDFTEKPGAYWRIHPGAFDAGDIHDKWTSELWASGIDSDEAKRHGLSTTATLEDLVDYFAGGSHLGLSPGRSATLEGVHLVQVEGTPTEDIPWEKEQGETLITPARIISSTPIEKTPFIEMVSREINAIYGDSDTEYIYDPASDDWKKIPRGTKELSHNARELLDEYSVAEFQAVYNAGKSHAWWEDIKEKQQDDPEAFRELVTKLIDGKGDEPQKNAHRYTANQLNAALEELTSRGTPVVFAEAKPSIVDTRWSTSSAAGDINNAVRIIQFKPLIDEPKPTLIVSPERKREIETAGGLNEWIHQKMHPQKYAADPWTPFTGPLGGKGWQNSQTGRVFYGPNKPGRDEPGEEVAAPPQAAGPPEPSMSDPIPLPPGTAKGLGATGAPGLPNFTEPPGAGEPGGAAEWGSTESLASLYGRDNMSPQTAQRFNVSAAKLMGLEIPEGQKEQQQALAEEFLRHNAGQLSETMNAAESMGWKPRGKRLITNAGSAARWLVGQAEEAGYERQGGGMSAELAGAVNHLQDSEQAIQAAPGLQAAVEAYAAMSKLVGPLLALPLAIAYGYLNKGGTSAVAGANTHLDQLSERLGIRSPFVATTRVEPKPEKPIKLRPEDFLPEKTAPIEPTVRKTTPEDIPAGTPKAPPRRTRRQVGGEIAGETRQENVRLLQEEIGRIPESARADFTTQYKALLDDRSQTVSKIRGQRDELLANIAGTQGMGVMTRQIQRADDPDQVKGFDLLVQLVENAPERYSDLMGVGELGQSAGEIQDRLFDVLKKPKGYFQPPQAHQVADELATEWLRQETAAEERTASQMDAEAETASFDPSSPTFGEGPAVEEFDPQAEPFSKRPVWTQEAIDKAKAFGKRMAEKYGFKESEHPRESSGTPEGGRFAGGEKSGSGSVAAANPRDAGEGMTRVDLVVGGEVVGNAVAAKNKHDDSLFIDWLGLEEEHQGKGLGRDALRALHKHFGATNPDFRTSDFSTKAAGKFWDRMREELSHSQKSDPYAQKFARDLSTGKLPNLSALPDPEVTIAEADRVLAVRPEDGQTMS